MPRVKVANLIGALSRSVEYEMVRPEAAGQNIGAGPAGDHVSTGAAIDGVDAGTAVDGVVARAAGDGVGATEIGADDDDVIGAGQAGAADRHPLVMATEALICRSFWVPSPLASAVETWLSATVRLKPAALTLNAMASMLVMVVKVDRL